jgi:hypothetical protein
MGGINMVAIKNVKTTAEEIKIDNIVKRQALDEDAWELDSKLEEKSIPTSIRLSSRTIKRAKFFASVYKQRGYQSWLKRVIEDRINTEYEIYKRLKKNTESH